MTDIDVYQPAAVDGYQARMIMTPDQARALDDQVRACTRAVLRPGTDYGIVPGAGDRQILFKPGAEKLLQWFGFAFRMERLEIDLDDDGCKQGVTYRCTIVKRVGDPDRGLPVEVATCEGYAGYDESKFFKPVSDAARVKAEKTERAYAVKDRRPANPDKWKKLEAYRAPWNTVIKMAQKRAIVGATIYATAAGGLFSTEEDAGPIADDGSTWYEQAQAAAASFTDPADEGRLYVEAARAHRDGWCNKAQQDEIQHAIRKRGRELKNVTVVDADAIVRQDAAGEPDEAGDEPPHANAARPQLLGVIAQHFDRLSITERDERLSWTSKLAGRDLTSSKELTADEARNVAGQLWKCQNLGDLTALLADGEAPDDGGDMPHA